MDSSINDKYEESPTEIKLAMEQDKPELSLYEKVHAEKDSAYKEKLISIAWKHFLGGNEIEKRNEDLKGLPYGERMMKLSQRHFFGTPK